MRLNERIQTAKTTVLRSISLKNNASIEERVKQVVADVFSINESKVNSDTCFIADFDADSLSIFQFVVDLEKEFSLDIPDEHIGKFKTVGETVAYVKAKLA